MSHNYKSLIINSLPRYDEERVEGGEVSEFDQTVKQAFEMINIICIVIFTLEIIARLICTPQVNLV